MDSSDIRDVLTSFSPSLDFFAISAGDGRIKIWDTIKGQVQTEFADILLTDESDIFSKPKAGHLSVDYTCMKWLSLSKKKKRKLGGSLLLLGTGGGDVLALDVSAGQLKWKIDDCHPGGVTAISFPSNGSSIYTAGTDGLVCEVDSLTGNLLGKFKASSKAISSMCVSPDGKVLATAAAQIRIFRCADRKKIQKFSGHPGAVRCMVFSEDGKYVLSSASGDRYVAVWELDGSKKKSAFRVLAMDHPAVLLDCRQIDSDDEKIAGLSVVAISEMGTCYYWHVKDNDESRNSKATKLFISIEDGLSKKLKGPVPTIFAAKLVGVAKPQSGHIYLAYNLLVKPSFEKILVQPGEDIKLTSSLDGILLPSSRSIKPKKGLDAQNITALDRSNADGALLPIHKFTNLADGKSEAKPATSKDDIEIDEVTICLEDRLRSQGILSNDDNIAYTSMLHSPLLKRINLEASMPQRKMRATVLSMEPSDAYKLLKDLLSMWQSRPSSGKFILPWICCLLANHGDYVKSQETATQLFDSLLKLIQSKGEAIQSLLQLSGRLQLVEAQIDKAANRGQTVDQGQVVDESDDENEDEDVAEDVLYGEEDDESQSSSDGDD